MQLVYLIGMTTSNVTVKEYKPWQFKPGNPGGPGRPAQLTVQQLLDKATTREEAIEMLLSVARNANHRDRYRAIERIVSYYFGTPRINMDVTTNSEPALLMRQLWMAMAGETNVLDPDVNVIDVPPMAASASDGRAGEAGQPQASGPAPTEAAELLTVDTSQDS